MWGFSLRLLLVSVLASSCTTVRSHARIGVSDRTSVLEIEPERHPKSPLCGHESGLVLKSGELAELRRLIELATGHPVVIEPLDSEAKLEIANLENKRIPHSVIQSDGHIMRISRFEIQYFAIGHGKADKRTRWILAPCIAVSNHGWLSESGGERKSRTSSMELPNENH